jgi:hypothetical protein
MGCSLFCDIGSGPSAGAGVSLLTPLLLKYYEGYSRHELLKLGRFSRGSSAVPVSHWHVQSVGHKNPNFRLCYPQLNLKLGSGPSLALMPVAPHFGRVINPISKFAFGTVKATFR